MRGAIERLELICDTYLSVSTPYKLAAPALIDAGAEVRAAILRRVQCNHRELRRCPPSTGRLRCWLRRGMVGGVAVPPPRSEEDLSSDFSSSDGVLVHPGFFFDFPHEAFLIVSLLPETATFKADDSRAGAGAVPDRRFADRPSRRNAGAAVLDSLAGELGCRGDHRICRCSHDGSTLPGSTSCNSAGQRDGRRAEFAVLGAQCDGDRSDLHRPSARSKSSPPPAAKRRFRRDRATLEQVRSSPSVGIRTFAGSNGGHSAPRLNVSSAPSGGRIRRAHANSAISSIAKVVARRLHAVSRAPRRALRTVLARMGRRAS